MSAPHSLTVILPLRAGDVELCQAALVRQRRALERGWAEIPGLRSACLAILPGELMAAPALLLECSFETEFKAFTQRCFARLGPELSAVLGHCDGYPEAPDASAFTEYLGSRAQRSFAFAASASSSERELGGRFWRLWDSLYKPRARSTPVADEQTLEARRSAVGMQEPVVGVPLLHVTWLRPGTRERLMRALHDLTFVPALVQHDARFLLGGSRLVFVAYPSENAQRWSERLSRVALAAVSRIWRNCREFAAPLATRRDRRERRLADFVLEHRVPIAVWFNVRAPRPKQPGES